MTRDQAVDAMSRCARVWGCITPRERVCTQMFFGSIVELLKDGRAKVSTARGVVVCDLEFLYFPDDWPSHFPCTPESAV